MTTKCYSSGTDKKRGHRMVDGEIVEGVLRSPVGAALGGSASAVTIAGINLPLVIQLGTAVLVVAQAAYWVSRLVKFLRGRE